MKNTNTAMKVRRLGRRLSRGVTLVEVLIVVAIMAMISAGVAIGVIPKYRESQIRSAMTDARTIRKAAELYNATYDSDKCPTVADLVSSKQIDGAHTDDPWGKPYKITCGDGDIRVSSSGKDKQDNTGDDVRDDMKDSDIRKILEK